MSDLATWLRAQLDADERDIEESRALSGDLHWSMPDWLHRDRMLAEVTAKRRIIDLAIPPVSAWHSETLQIFTDDVLRLLALPYAGRPGYRQEWKP